MSEPQSEQSTSEAVQLIPVRDNGQTETLPVEMNRSLGNLLDVSALMLTARRMTRDVNLAIKQTVAVCTMDETTAKECFYALPRAGKKISGPSIGLAETLASFYGNLIVDTDNVDIEDEWVVVCGYIVDLETGLVTRSRERRRITDKNGNRYNQDMIQTTIKAAQSILWRNLVLRVVPRPIVRKIYDAARNVAIGGENFADRQKKCAKYWKDKHKITQEKLLQHLGLTEVGEITIEDLEYLLGIDNAIKLGDTSIEDVFKPRSVSHKRKSLDDIADDLSEGTTESTEEQQETVAEQSELA